jgi:hypothetical protein
MSRGPVDIIQDAVNTVWRLLSGRPAKAKLHGRRGYGDDGIAAPNPDEK